MKNKKYICKVCGRNVSQIYDGKCERCFFKPKDIALDTMNHMPFIVDLTTMKRITVNSKLYSQNNNENFMDYEEAKKQAREEANRFKYSFNR